MNYKSNINRDPKDMELKDFDTKWFVGVSFNNFHCNLMKGFKINRPIKILSNNSSLKVNKTPKIKSKCDCY